MLGLLGWTLATLEIPVVLAPKTFRFSVNLIVRSFGLMHLFLLVRNRNLVWQHLGVLCNTVVIWKSERVLADVRKVIQSCQLVIVNFEWLNCRLLRLIVLFSMHIYLFELRRDFSLNHEVFIALVCLEFFFVIFSIIDPLNRMPAFFLRGLVRTWQRQRAHLRVNESVTEQEFLACKRGVRVRQFVPFRSYLVACLVLQPRFVG